MKRLHFLIIILFITIFYKIIDMKIDNYYHLLEIRIDTEFINIYQKIDNQNDLINLILNKWKKKLKK